MHMLVSMYYCIYMFSYGPYGPEIKHYYYIIIIITDPTLHLYSLFVKDSLPTFQELLPTSGD